ncbi:glycoside hydrolase [Phytophthora sojae]|uniref:beta-glucosidase n=1 Tax=Phytophthora sojae (strain P6497) TaxID=1094619 RepID=G4YVD8_PHYSP|nr:glycoside hydrolase [Phytophthora sojae]EGZ24944.1 glycoside hydrolase [Phytophthora sojae]|eukprot:XP_009520232.1 glycoside hydrolase [Phytophthora sojae]
MLGYWLIAACCTALSLAAGAATDDLDARAAVIVENLSPDEVVGQLTQISINYMLNEDYSLNEEVVRTFANLHVGSFLVSPFVTSPNAITGEAGWNATKWRSNIARIQGIVMEENNGVPMIYGLDSVHGAGFVLNATLFGAQINAAATFNPDLVCNMGLISAQDTLAAGQPAVAAHLRDVRVDTYLVTVMSESLIRGLQANNQTAACMKHFVAYSKTPTGRDKDGTQLSDFDLLNYFVPPFKAAIAAGVKTAMENYISINGVPVIGNHKILQQLLREDLGFTGLTVSDFDEFGDYSTAHRIARNVNESIRFSYNLTGIDMSMAYDTKYLNATKALLEQSPEYLDRLKESAHRIINTKLQNNDSTLPIPSSSTIFLTGHSAHNIGNQCGGWSVRWHGYTGNEYFPNGISVKEGLEAFAGDKVTYFNGLNADGIYSDANLTTAKRLAIRLKKTGDLDDLALPAGQVEYVKELASSGSKVILVLFEGRPRLLGGLPAHVHAVINGILACEQAGKALAEIIYGHVNPSGRMPITYPKDAANILMPYNHRVSTRCADNEYCEMQWDFGAGLSYTNFTYSDLVLSRTTVTSSSDTIDVSVTVTNSGSVVGKETVMLFITQPYRSISVPEVKQLKKFSKISLEPGQSQHVYFTLTADDWSVYYPQIGQGLKQVAEDADYVVAINPETDCDVYNETAAANPLCATFTLQTGEYPYGSFLSVAN